MNPLKAIIIDDEPLAHRIIERYAADVPFLNILGHCYFATEAYPMITAHAIDVIFLDIQLPKLSGLDFLRTLDAKPDIIITTAFEEYALEGFELQVSDYLLKPFSFDRFLKAVNIVRMNVENKNPQLFEHRKLFVKVDKRQIQISTEHIQCFESYGNYVKIWRDGEMILTPRTLSSFEEELPMNQFQRVHKSFIVNKNFIDFVEGNSIQMKNKMTVPIGKNHRQDIRNWFG